jgi:hypothetical protein
MADRGGELKRDRLRVEETVELPSRNGVPAESTVTPARAPTPTPTLTPDKA